MDNTSNDTLHFKVQPSDVLTTLTFMFNELK